MPQPPMDLVEKVIRINSMTHVSNDDLVRFLVPLLEECGLAIEEQKVNENGVSFRNVIASSHGTERENLLVLNTHLDTVSAGSFESWTKTNGDPFKATRVRDRIYGLGSADVKLDFLCKIMAAKASKPWVRPFALVGTYGEERGLIGVSQLFTGKRIKPTYALVGEPSNLELIYAHKGHLVVTVLFELGHSTDNTLTRNWKGKSAHSATPQLGENALVKGLNDITKRGLGIRSLKAGLDSNKIPDSCEAVLSSVQDKETQCILRFARYVDELSKDLRRRKDTRFSPANTTLSLNMAEIHHRELKLTFDMRTLPDSDLSKIHSRLVKDITTMGGRIVESIINNPLRGKKDSRFMNIASSTLRKCGIRVIKKTKASSTEAAVYQQHGAEAIVFGPGLSAGNVHRPNEYNSVRQMAEATRFYTELLKVPVQDY